MDLIIDSNIPIKEYQITEQGYLRFITPIAKVGKMLHFADGKPYYQHVSAQVLTDSAETFKFLPVVDEHPRDSKGKAILVDSSNATQYQKGSTLHLSFFDGAFLWLNGVVNDSQLIHEIITKRKRQVSPGYLVGLSVDGTEVHQKSRKGNHLAFTVSGRGGAEIGLNIDSFDTADKELIESYYADLDLQIDSLEIPNALITGNIPVILTVDNSAENKTGTTQALPTKRQEETKNMKTVKIGEQVFEINDDSLASAIETLIGDSANLQLTNDSLTTQLQTLNTARNALANQLTEALAKQIPQAQVDADELNTQIQARLSLWSVVTPAIQVDNADFKPDYSLEPNEIRALWVKHKNPSLSVAIDSMNTDSNEFAAFIQGAYSSNPPKEIKVNQADSMFNALNVSGQLPGVSSTQQNITDPALLVDSLTEQDISDLRFAAYGSTNSNNSRQALIDQLAK